jgi:hypothetical protein
MVGLADGRNYHGALALEQTYGYMICSEVRFGALTTYNSFIFLKRDGPGILYISRIIPVNTTPFPMLKLLYYFTHLCALNTDPLPEPRRKRQPVEMTRDTDVITEISESSNSGLKTSVTPTPLPPPTSSPGLRRSPRWRPQNDLSLDDDLTPLGFKGWRGTLNTGRTVFVKLWDQYKCSSSSCKHEATVYYHLRHLWGSVIPDFIGVGKWSFFHILMLANVDVCPRLTYKS